MSSDFRRVIAVVIILLTLANVRFQRERFGLNTNVLEATATTRHVTTFVRPQAKQATERASPALVATVPAAERAMPFGRMKWDWPAPTAGRIGSFHSTAPTLIDEGIFFRNPRSTGRIPSAESTPLVANWTFGTFDFRSAFEPTVWQHLDQDEAPLRSIPVTDDWSDYLANEPWWTDSMESANLQCRRFDGWKLECVARPRSTAVPEPVPQAFVWLALFMFLVASGGINMVRTSLYR
ncbi:MAG: hypothetical protein KDA87_02625 [Planctomycetales bacterium]|nr:hypothetical protein [Planctomycetales bacterium]